MWTRYPHLTRVVARVAMLRAWWFGESEMRMRRRTKTDQPQAGALKTPQITRLSRVHLTRYHSLIDPSSGRCRPSQSSNNLNQSKSTMPSTPQSRCAPMSPSHHVASRVLQVYECMVRGIAVMRRRADSYVNATQILKVAGVDKGRRTKILEKEILPGKHEIVQGGYGKYQGTWSVEPSV